MSVQKLTRPSESEAVDEYMKHLDHPLAEVVASLRRIILDADPEIGEEVKWNAPTFYYTGEMEPFDPKEYKRHLVIFNLFKKDGIRLVFWDGAKVDDKSGFLQGSYTDGRRLAEFNGMSDVEVRKSKLQEVVRRQVSLLR